MYQQFTLVSETAAGYRLLMRPPAVGQKWLVAVRYSTIRSAERRRTIGRRADGGFQAARYDAQVDCFCPEVSWITNSPRC
jgi:hypothetical protein